MHDRLSGLSEQTMWLRHFEARHKRKLRVLHVGNIANNAYLNAKFLRSVGIEAHVLCCDYYHVMAMPEWEDVELQQGHGDDYHPHFAKSDLRGYRRPAWFINAPLIAAPQLAAELCEERASWRQRLTQYIQGKLVRFFDKLNRTAGGRAIQLLLMDPPMFFFKLSCLLKEKTNANSLMSLFTDRYAGWLRRRTTVHLHRWIAAYDKAFPARSDRLTTEDIAPFYSSAAYFRKIFRHYDIVQCYATDPIGALLADKRPFVAFEHGTLRDFTMGDLPLHRLTALAYREADHTFITNGDCLTNAGRLGIKNFSPMIHPIDVAQHRTDYGDAIAKLRAEINADVVLFCPIRHDWKIKGIDTHLRALPAIKARIAGNVKLLLIRWGKQAADSGELIESLGCTANVIWRRSMCRITMIKHIRAADIVLDQMALPHFGATAPQAIAAGTPVISSYDPESTRWIIPEPAPILSAFSPEDVADAVVKALDPEWRVDYKNRAREWIDKYHHPDNIIRSHLRVYRQVLERYGSSTRA